MVIETLYRTYCERSIFHFENSAKTLDPDEIHDLRVNLRRLRALTGVLRVCGFNILPKVRRQKLGLIFREAGRVRDLQTQLRLCDYFGERLNTRFVLIKRKLGLDLSMEKTRFEKICTANPLSVLLLFTPDILEKLAGASSEAVVAELTQGCAAIPDLLIAAAHAPSDRIHALRIRLKKMKYKIDILNHMTDEVTTENKILRSQIAAWQDRFGFWHDLEVHRDHLTIFEKEAGLDRLQSEKLSRLYVCAERTQQSVLAGRFKIPKIFL